MREGHRERGRGTKDEGATREGKGCRGGVGGGQQERGGELEKGLSVEGEQRPNRREEGG